MFAHKKQIKLLTEEKISLQQEVKKCTSIIEELKNLDKANREENERIKQQNEMLAKTEEQSREEIEQLCKEKDELNERFIRRESAFIALQDECDKLVEKTILLQATLDEQNTILTDQEGRKIVDAKAFLANVNRREVELTDTIKKQEEKLDELKRKKYWIENELSEKQQKIIELDDQLLLQEVGLYKPLYAFARSSEYKWKLEECRAEQKQMIRDGTAVVCAADWMVNGDIALGKKMIGNRIKEVILMFNTECENAIEKVKYNNYESMDKRISRMYEKLNSLNEAQQIVISEEYLKLKHEELALAFEYAMKVQEEKEYIREQREIERENAKVQKDIEEERKRIAKEKTHYENALQRLKEQLLETVLDPEKQAAIEERIADVNSELKDLEEALKQVDYRQANERAGYVYVISNIGAFGENVYKIGMTRRLDPMDRIDELSGAAVPFRYDVHALIFSADAPKLESALHNAFSDYRLNSINNRKEFFRVPLEEIERVVRENHDRSVDFQYIPAAEQYRQSKAKWEVEHCKSKSGTI